MRGIVGRVLREPLLHFLIAGGVLFAVLSSGGQVTVEAPPANRIVVTAQDVARLSRAFEATWRRPPTADELARLIKDHIEQEIYVREALALGLDQGDAVVRNRLRQKMEFLTQAMAGTGEPSDADLAAYLAENAARYSTPGLTGFDQVYLGPNPDRETVSAVLTALNGGADPGSAGAQTLLPVSLRPSVAQAIDGAFGGGFAAALAGLPLDAWGGPVRSGYGLHLVRVTARTAPAPGELAVLRDRLADDWRRERTAEAAEAWLQARQEAYDIILPPEAAASGGSHPDGSPPDGNAAGSRQ